MLEVKSLNVPEVQLISGHTDPRVLMRVYANLRPKDLAEKLVGSFFIFTPRTLTGLST